MVIGAPRGAWYVPALQSAFLVAFVVFAPWVGGFADARSKPRVLLIGNALKAAGAAAMLAGAEPIAAYAIVGAGAAVYGPAKYGVLPELVPPSSLVRANGLIEGSTIVAIIFGTIIGGRLADRSVPFALGAIVLCYVASAAVTLLLPKLAPAGASHEARLRSFGRRMRAMFATARARFAMLGNSLFWASAAVLRLLLVAWAPAVLATRTAAGVADLTLPLALGIV